MRELAQLEEVKEDRDDAEIERTLAALNDGIKNNEKWYRRSSTR